MLYVALETLNSTVNRMTKCWFLFLITGSFEQHSNCATEDIFSVLSLNLSILKSHNMKMLIE